MSPELHTYQYGDISKYKVPFMTCVGSMWLNRLNFVIAEWLFLDRISMECISKYKVSLMTFFFLLFFFFSGWRNCWNFVIIEKILLVMIDMKCISKYKVPLMTCWFCVTTFQPLLLLTSFFWLELLSDISPKIRCL